jgi:DNA-binding response OmpR family regulator
MMLEMLKNYTILYVEDEPEVKKDMEEYLSAYFKTLYSASDGELALELYYQHRPDVLLLDISIPKISGLDLAKEIRQHDYEVKIIMLTAHDDSKRLLAATELKLTKYLVKPFSPKRFKETLKVLLKELQKNDSNFLNFGNGYIWNKTNEQLILKDEKVKLCEKEHRLLKLFLSKKTQTTTYEDIMVAVWENSFEQEISLDSVKNLVSRLRKKLPSNFINSVYKEGYILNKF